MAAFAATALSSPPATAATAPQRGYVLVDTIGATTGFGEARPAGTLLGVALANPIVDGVNTPSGRGHILVSAEGGIFAFGDAPYLGSMVGTPLNAPIVSVDITPSGRGYVLFAADGAVFAFGDARFRGSLGSIRLNRPIVDGALTEDNDGYILVAGDGGVFAFGRARFGGSTASIRLNAPIVGVLLDDDGPGYALVGSDGGLFSFNGFSFVGSLGSLRLNAPITDAVLSSTGDGYLLLGTDGAVFAFGDAPFVGSMASTPRLRPFVAILGLSNQAPEAEADRYGTTEDAGLVVPAATGVLANDVDDDGDTMTAAVVTGPTKGTLALASDGSFTYTPNPNANGTDSFTYGATDGKGASDTATATITIAPVNDAPVADDEAFTTAEDTALNVVAPGVLDGDTDVDGNPLTASVVTGPTTGSLTVNANGSFTYTPNANTNGPDSFTYKANDGSADSNTATVTLTVNAVNDTPTAVNDTYSTDEDTPLNVAAPGVLANDSDIEGSPLTAVLATGPTKGTLTLDADGSFTYTPNADANGADSFTYRANDGTADGNTATVTLTVNAVNDAPVADNDAHSTNEDTPLNVVAPGVLDGDVDVDGDPLTAVLVSGPSNGTLTLNADGSFAYTPNVQYNGADSFTYKADDGPLDSNTATVTLTVNAVNDAPVADNDAYSTDEDTPLNVVAPGVLDGDTDVDLDTLTAGSASDPANGAVMLNADGSFTYTPDTGFTGNDTFSYDASDGDLEDTATVTINVFPPNATPTADATSASGNEDGGAVTVTLTGHDDDGDGLTFAVGTATKGFVTVPGAVTCSGTPSTCTTTVTYEPSSDFNGGDSFTYTVNDGTISSAPATATMTTNAVNDAPSFTKGGAQTVLEDAGAQTVNGWATAISSGPTNESGQAVTFGVTTDNDGLFSTLPAVSSAGVLTYSPAANADGSATVSVKAVDDGGTTNGGVNESAVQTFTVTVTPVNDAPSFTKGADQTVNEDAGARSISNWATAISKGPANESAQALSFAVTSNSNPSLFSVAPAVSATGTLTYTSAANIYGSATLEVRLSDDGGTANGGANTTPAQSFTITVNAVNDAPTAAAKSFDIQTNMKRSVGGLLAGATDANDVAGDATWSPTFTVGSVTAGSECVGCTVSNVDLAAGTFDFEAPAGGTGTYKVTYTVVDDGHPSPGVASAAQEITFNVAGPVVWFVNDATGNDTTGDGTLARPFKTLGKAATVDAANHRIFLHSGTYADGITLFDGEWLIGAGTKAASFDSFMGITPPEGTVARPAISGTNPTVQGAVTLGSGNTVRGLTLAGSPALSGTSFGTLSTGAGGNADVGLNSSGQALSLTTGTISGDFTGTTSAGGTNNVLLSSVGTTATSLGSGALSGASSEGFRVSGGTGTFTYSGTVGNAGGTTVSIANKTGGTVTFNGAVSDATGAGVALSDNTGATITFNGGVTLTSGTSPAFAATGGGTVTVTGTANTLASTTGTALNVDNTTIGASGLTFRSISANGAANGIVLNATGSSGALSVTGTGITAGSGGVIQSTTGDGVSLTNTRDVSLANLNVINAGHHGILGSGVTNLTLTRVQVAGAGDADNEYGVFLTNQAGTLAISGGTYSDSSDNLVLVQNTNTNLTATINNSAAFQNLTTTFANNALQFVPNGSSAINATVSGVTFTNIKNSSVHVGAAAAGSSGSSSLTFSGNTVTSDASSAGGMVVSGQENTTTTLTVNSNTFTTAGGNGVVSLDANDNSVLLATVTNNTFTSPKGHGIVANVDETADTRVRIENNMITNAGGDGIELTNFGDDSAAADVSTAHFIVRNNTINGHSTNSAVRFVGGIGIFNFEGDGDTVCAAVTGNSVSGTPATYFDIYLQDSALTAGNFTFEENPNTGATGAVTEAFVKSLNPSTTEANNVSSGPVYSNGTTCLAP